MRVKITLILALLLTSLIPQAPAEAVTDDLAQKLAGRILLQVESYGRSWYVDPVSLRRYYLQDGNVAYTLMRQKGLGITNKDLFKIPTYPGQPSNEMLVNRLRGRILLQVENNGEAWYVDPVSGIRQYLRDGQAAYDLMRSKSLGIKNIDLARILMNEEQLAHDTTFKDVAYVSFDGIKFSHEYNADRILPLASLTKLVSALVLLDTNPEWTKRITITSDQINYPKTLVGNDTTSEIDLASGDTVTVYDLWVAMLVASSNQSVIALVDNSGMSRADFVRAMNDKAISLGLTKTRFYDPTGLDAHNITTAKEMARIAHVAFTNDIIASAGKQSDYTIAALDKGNALKKIYVKDRNFSLHDYNLDASKTGFLVEAQRTLAVKQGNTIGVVLHALSMSQRNSIVEKLIQPKLVY